MDKKKIQEKAREAAKFTYEVIDDIFGKRILIFAYILAAIFAASVISLRLRVRTATRTSGPVSTRSLSAPMTNCRWTLIS